jgi:hypothetical protein
LTPDRSRSDKTAAPPPHRWDPRVRTSREPRPDGHRGPSRLGF